VRTFRDEDDLGTVGAADAAAREREQKGGLRQAADGRKGGGAAGADHGGAIPSRSCFAPARDFETGAH
jgi:hypothetical protein